MTLPPTKCRKDILGDPPMRPGRDSLEEGRRRAANASFGQSAFARQTGYHSEIEAKRVAIAQRRIMQHAHIGFRSMDRTVDAIGEVFVKAGSAGAKIDRFGIALDWSMGYPASHRKGKPKGTGIILDGAADMVRIANAAPAAVHFGDFMLGLPAALENTEAAIAAGVTSIGNLGQYFTFRLPFWDDDVATTETTVAALGFIAAQNAEILVHSNLDDGFAALFEDMASSIGMALIEKYIVEDLVGTPLAHCYGHHFSDPLTRHAFHRALAKVSDTPGTMIFGNTTSYRSTPAGNYASLATYLLTDIAGQKRFPTGHAVNPVPVTENERIPDIDEIVDVQVFAARLIDQSVGYDPLLDWAQADAISDILIEKGRIFSDTVISGLKDRGIDTGDPAELLIALRRIGARGLEQEFGAGDCLDGDKRRSPVVVASWLQELRDMSRAWQDRVVADGVPILSRPLRMCASTTDVHEHGKYLIERSFSSLGMDVIDGGVAVDVDQLLETALAGEADFIAISTYNGVALSYCAALKKLMREQGVDIPVLVGGRLNQIPEDSNTGLPVDVVADLKKLGLIPCASLDDALAALKNIFD